MERSLPIEAWTPTKPPPVIQQKGVKSPPLPRGILRQKKSSTISSPFGKFRFHSSTDKKPLIAEDHTQSKAPRNYNTYLSWRTGKITEGYGAGESQIVHYFHAFFDLLLKIDNTTVFYAFPGREAHSRHVVPYSKDHVLPRKIGKLKRLMKIETKAELLRYVSRCNVNPGSSTWMNIWIGHDLPIEDIFTADFEHHVITGQMVAIIMDVQAPTSTTIGYLLMLDPQTTDCEELTELVQESKYFAKLPISIKVQELRLTKDQKKKDWKDPDRVDIVTIMCSANKMKPTIKAYKKIFKAIHPKDLGNCPGGISAKFFPWYADRDSPNPTREQRNHALIARHKQKSWAKKVVRITLDAVQNLHLPIEHLGNQITLHQALVCCRTSAMGDFRLFSSVNYIPTIGECVAVCTSTSEKEVDSVIENLIPLCREHFGPSVKYWFTDEAWQENIHRSYNRQTQTIDEDVAYKTVREHC